MFIRDPSKPGLNGIIAGTVEIKESAGTYTNAVTSKTQVCLLFGDIRVIDLPASVFQHRFKAVSYKEEVVSVTLIVVEEAWWKSPTFLWWQSVCCASHVVKAKAERPQLSLPLPVQSKMYLPLVNASARVLSSRTDYNCWLFFEVLVACAY